MVGNIKSILKSSLVLLLGVIFIYFFFRFLPILILAGIAVYGFLRIRSRIKTWRGKKQQSSDPEIITEEIDDNKYDFTNKKVIDVEYYDVKK